MTSGVFFRTFGPPCGRKNFFYDSVRDVGPALLSLLILSLVCGETTHIYVVLVLSSEMVLFCSPWLYRAVRFCEPEPGRHSDLSHETGLLCSDFLFIY